MKTKYPNIFEPLTVKRTTIRNRIAMTPMGTNYGEANGEMSNRHMNYYSLRAKGGVGLIILETVSYTHLDVYKRQIQVRFRPGCFAIHRP